MERSQRCGRFSLFHVEHSRAIERTRGRKLQEIRKRWLRAYPLCAHCFRQGVYRAATEVDHVVALVNGGADDDSNRQSLCDPCHKQKNVDDMRVRDGKTPRVATGVDGYPIED